MVRDEPDYVGEHDATDVQARINAALAVQAERLRIAEEEREEALLLARAAEANNESKKSPPPVESTTKYVMLNSAQITANATDLEPGRTGTWHKLAISALAKNTPHWAKLAKTLTTEESFTELYDSDAKFASQDEFNAGMIMAMLNKKSVHVTNFLDTVVQRDEARLEADTLPLIADSAWLLGALALEQAGCGDGIKRMSRIQQFKNKPYFGQVMNIEQYIAVSNELRTDFNLLPESERKDEYAVFKALLGKLPPAMEATTKEYSDKILKKETLGQPLKWTYEQLVQLLAIEYTAINGTDLTVRTGKSAATGPKKCTICGEAGHYAGQRDDGGRLVCKAMCKGCGEKNCPAAMGDAAKCILTLGKMPPHSQYLNAAGNTVPTHIYNFLVKKHAERCISCKSASVGTGTGEGEDNDELTAARASMFTML